MPPDPNSPSLPHSLEAERSVLGAILIDNQAMHAAESLLRPEDFYRDSHRRIFLAAQRISERGTAIDLVTLCEELDRGKELEGVGGAAVVASLTDGVPRSAHIDDYARIVKQKATLRRLIDASQSILRTAFESGEDTESIVDEAEKQIFKVAEDRLRGGFQPLGQIADPAIAALEALTRRQELVTGVATGFERLDELTSGLQRGELIVVAARPSMGKTAFCLNIAQTAALRHGRTVGIFSLEMSSEQLFQRLLCSESRIDAHLLRTGRIGKPQWERIMKAFYPLEQAPIYIDDSAGSSISEMRGKARRLKAEHGLDLLIIDYLQLMRGRGRYESRQQEISDISRALKELARELNVPVIAVSQLSRAPEQRGGEHRRPQLSDLRESGAIEQDADVVIFIYREEFYGRTEENEGIADVIIGKQRNGPVDTLQLAFIKEITRFDNLARREG